MQSLITDSHRASFPRFVDALIPLITLSHAFFMSCGLPVSNSVSQSVRQLVSQSVSQSLSHTYTSFFLPSHTHMYAHRPSLCPSPTPTYIHRSMLSNLHPGLVHLARTRHRLLPGLCPKYPRLWHHASIFCSPRSVTHITSQTYSSTAASSQSLTHSLTHSHHITGSLIHCY